MAVKEFEGTQYKLERLTNEEVKTELAKKNERDNVILRAEKLSILVCAFINDISRFLIT